jgi:hypothetical protein
LFICKTDSNLFDAEERLIRDHVSRLLAAFRSATVVVIVEANSDFRWPARLCQVMTREFGQRVKFVCSWKDVEKQSIGVQTGKREKFSAAYYANELFRDNMVMYWDGFFSCGFAEPGTTAKEFHVAQLKQVRLEPRGADRFDDPELVVTGKSGNDQDDLAIATILGLMWSALFKFDPAVMARFGIPVISSRMRPPSRFLTEKIDTGWKSRMRIGKVPEAEDPVKRARLPFD